LEVLVLLTAVGTIYTALKSIKPTDDNQFLYLKLFTTAQDPLPAFVFFLAILVPLLAIALSFDSINGEFSRRTLSRVLAQPVYRDALLLGKFLGGLLTLTMVFSAISFVITAPSPVQGDPSRPSRNGIALVERATTHLLEVARVNIIQAL